MERSEPTFVPEWYKISNSSAAGSGNSNHQSGFSLQSDEHKIVFSSRSRLAVSICDYDAPQSLSFSERTSSSLRRSTSSNGCIGHDKDFSSRICNSFGRNQRDSDMNRDQDFEIHDRDKPLFPDHRFSDYADVSWSVKSEKDSLRHSQSTLSRRRADSWLKRAGHDSSNGYQSMGGSGRISGVTKYSFERDFPSLGAEEKHVGSDAIRVSSPVQTISYHNLPVATTINRVDSWTSVLAEVPNVGDNGLIVSTALQKSSVLATSSTSTGLNMTVTCLNMAETVAQAPARALTAPQLPNDSQKIEKLHRQQFLKLRPVTPSMPKNLQVVNPADKSKTKGLKMAEYSTVKMGQHMSSQPAHRSVRSNIKPDLPKTYQSAHFHVLNWEKNGASLNVKDSLHPRNGSRSAITYLTGQVHPKHGVNGKASALASSSFGEKKPSSQAQNRNDFFNSLRKKSPSGQENTNQDTRCGASAPSSEKSGAVDAGVSEKEKDASPNCSEENGNCSGSLIAVEEPERLVPDEEEAAFLRSLGWEENAGEEALTTEEIQSFLSEYEKKKLVLKLKVAGCSAKLSSSSETTQAEASFC